MDLRAEHEVRDPIHGLVRLTDQEMGIVNTQAFQRLRRIRQLAMADLVYPGAVHTRFEHSLGTLHTAHLILDHLNGLHGVCDEDVRVVRLAALLHDIGHGPFSHVSEYLLDKHYDKSAVGEATAVEKIHEKITVDVIDKDDELASLLSQDDRNEIAGILSEGRTRDYRRDIVSSDLDADKMDYLLRDAHFAGVRYGSFDLDKVIDVCRRYERGNESYLVVDEEGIYAVEQLVLAKQYMTRQVYAHRVRTITDLMIVRGLELAIQDGHDDIGKLFAYDGSGEFIASYLQFDDGRLMSTALDDRYPRSKNVFERLRERKLYKEVAEIRLDDLGVDDSITRGLLLNLDQKGMDELERRGAALVGCEPWEVIAYRKSIKHPAYQESGGLEPDAIHVLPRNSTPKAMSEIPDLISPRLPTAERLHIIAPTQAYTQGTRQERHQATEDMKDSMTRMVFDYVGGGG